VCAGNPSSVLTALRKNITAGPRRRASRAGEGTRVCRLEKGRGGAESTAARVLRDLIDSRKAVLRAEPRDLHDLVIAANNSRVIGLDNLSYMPNWLSDELCGLATGGGFSTRTLYTDTDETIFDAQRPRLVNRAI
jgi:hypothetical protein